MLKMALTLISLSMILGCSSNSSGGNSNNGNDPANKPAGYAGACIEKVQGNDRTIEICTEYYQGEVKITEQQLQQECAAANLQFVKLCPNNSLVSCQLQRDGFSIILRIFDIPASKEAWAQGCQSQNGKVL